MYVTFLVKHQNLSWAFVGGFDFRVKYRNLQLGFAGDSDSDEIQSEEYRNWSYVTASFFFHPRQLSSKLDKQESLRQYTLFQQDALDISEIFGFWYEGFKFGMIIFEIPTTIHNDSTLRNLDQHHRHHLDLRLQFL